MQKFVRLLSAVAIVTVLVCSSAFAALDENGLLIPQNLSPVTDAYAISQDQMGANSGDLLKVYDVESDKTLTLTDYDLSFEGTPTNEDLRVKLITNDTKDNEFGRVGSGDFDKLLLRSTASTMELAFNVQTTTLMSPDEFWFGLAGGNEYNLSPDSTLVLAENCTIDCYPYFHHYMQHELINPATTLFPKTMVDTITWDGIGDKEYWVNCCPNFMVAAVLSGDKGLLTPLSGDATPGQMTSTDIYYTDSVRDMVVGHLSETPFLRVRITEAQWVTSDDMDSDLLNATTKDFRDARWTSYFFDDVVDVPEGETYNMGVQYSVFTDCSCCAAGACCQNPYVPYLAVTNLGTTSVYNGNNILDSEGLKFEPDTQNEELLSNVSWLCNSWCGLCEYDDFMSGDKGLLGYSSPEKIAHQSSLSDCPCHIFPAFTNTVKTAGNMDINYRANKSDGDGFSSTVVTRIAGRFNTSWARFVVGTGGLCATCTENIYLFNPCECLIEIYRKALGMNTLNFVKEGFLTLTSYNDKIDEDTTATANDYDVVDAVISDTAAASKDILLTQLNWTLTGTNLTDAGLVNETPWWRSDMWNKLKITINGHDLTAAGVTNVSGPADLTAAELSFLTVIDGPQRDLSDYTPTPSVNVSLFVFVVDSDEDAVKYYKNTKGNRFLVVYDGAKDGKFSYKAYVSRATAAPAPVVFGVNPATLELNLASADLTTGTVTAVNALLGAQIKWSVASTDFATVSPEFGATTTVTALKVGEVVVTAMVSGDEATSADCTVTIKNEEPTPTPSGDSSGGCNAAGFAPAMLLLVTPLVFFLKK